MGNTLSIKIYRVVNMGDFRSVVKYGTLPNTRGPEGNGYSVLPTGRTKAIPDFWVYKEEPIVAETRQLNKRYTWKIQLTDEDDWKMQFFVSMGGSEFVKVGAIIILHIKESFDLWTSGDSIVIANDDGGLAREKDDQSFRYFQVFKDRISYTNHAPV